MAIVEIIDFGLDSKTDKTNLDVRRVDWRSVNVGRNPSMR